ncbi:hypothetical protein I6N91_00850 [Arthrobacter sp. MSA 4-2]|uniref:hypothetical protein n=1 Tax=Arthrobacter sp. MSA 4-2 TaxID=2794349 RepID=UPI0018E70264|nr:hypothetical protein [Arthrobacter sp. MSA 4-2]MBJ2119523.1 hypothetical protein [Arthrobacter sp. MSA 4-2]
MAIAEDDGGEMVIGDVSRVGGRALAVGLSGAGGDEVLKIGWVEQSAELELTMEEAVALRDEIDRIIRDRQAHSQGR